MTRKKLLLGMLALTLTFGLMVMGCGEPSPGPDPNSGSGSSVARDDGPLNGTWVSTSLDDDILVAVINNGSFKQFLDEIPLMEGFYTINGNTMN